MIKNYKCPDGKIIKCEDCIENCIMSFRCTPPALPSYVYNHQRTWKGKLSVTQCKNPTCQSYLAITQDLTVSPMNHIYSMLGTINHSKHEQGGNETPNIESEIFLENDLLFGTTDMLEEKDGKYYLRDVKNKKCAQMYYLLDYEQVGEKKVALPSWKQTGSKLKKTDDVVFQLNCYRTMIEETRKIKISGMFMDVVLVDWSAISSPERYGLKYQHYVVPIPFVDDEEIINLVKESNDRIQYAIKTKGKDLKPCYEEEDRWCEFGKPGSYNRCHIYCDCKDACQEYFKKKGIEHKAFD